MKQFDELDKKERQSKNRVEIRSWLTKKNIVTVCICILVAFILALLWCNIYFSFQKKRLIEWQSENSPDDNNVTYEWNLGNAPAVASTDNNGTVNSFYEDLEIEFVGAEKSSSTSNYLDLYLKINNPNAEAVNILITGIYLNGVCVDEWLSMDIVGGKETIISELVNHTPFIANQIGDEIQEVIVQYNYTNENNNIHECKDSGFSYKIGDAEVNRGDTEKNVPNEDEAKKGENREIYGTLSKGEFKDLKVKYIRTENNSLYTEMNFLVENESAIDYDITFWYESIINGYTLEMNSSSEWSGDIVPAEGSALLTLKYDQDDLQYCGITKIDEICFRIGNDDTEWENATEVSFEKLNVDIPVTERTEFAINNRVEGILSEGEMSDNIKITYVGYSSGNIVTCLNFIVENTSSDYYDFSFWYASQVNKCAMNMNSSSEISGNLDGNSKVLFSIKYSTNDLLNAGIDKIDTISFSFANSLEKKEEASTAEFIGLNIPVKNGE